ncbi:hypothetical protein ACFMQL_09980 [Nonomuraea fastidiosa]|uniref:hypothetical protein n=1 Tax=Nonomuraea TaxID=83681 RepID=UPI0034288297
MPGPDRELMQAAVQRIQKLSDDNWWVLHASCRLMEARAWVGPTGDRFGQAVHNYQHELHMMLTQAVTMAKDAAARAQ